MSKSHSHLKSLLLKNEAPSAARESTDGRLYEDSTDPNEDADPVLRDDDNSPKSQTSVKKETKSSLLFYFFCECFPCCKTTEKQATVSANPTKRGSPSS